MLPFTADTLRVSLHILGAAGWVGGQFVLAGVVPTLRKSAPDVVSTVARRFQVLAWPFYGLLLATGVWNALEVDFDAATDDWISTFGIKMWLVLLSGFGAAAHAFFAGPRVQAAADDRGAARARALSGALAGVGLLAGIGALVLGVLLRG